MNYSIFGGVDLISRIKAYKENKASIKADEFINYVTGDKNDGEVKYKTYRRTHNYGKVKYKIYRGVDDDGKDCVYAENQLTLLTAVSSWENFKNMLVPEHDCCFFTLEEQCKNPKLLFEI